MKNLLSLHLMWWYSLRDCWGRRLSASYFTQLFGTNSHFPKAKADKKRGPLQTAILPVPKQRKETLSVNLSAWVLNNNSGCRKKAQTNKDKHFQQYCGQRQAEPPFSEDVETHTHLMNDRLSPVAKNDREKGDKECYTWVVSKRREKRAQRIFDLIF